MTEFDKAIAKTKGRGHQFVLNSQPYGYTVLCECTYDPETRVVSGTQVYESVTNRIFQHTNTNVDEREKPGKVHYVSSQEWEDGWKTTVAM